MLSASHGIKVSEPQGMWRDGKFKQLLKIHLFSHIQSNNKLKRDSIWVKTTSITYSFNNLLTYLFWFRPSTAML